MAWCIPGAGDVTACLIDWNCGYENALDNLMPLVYEEMRRLAAIYLCSERSALTLQPTVLVHETYIRLVAQKLPDWQSRSHFFGVVAYRMRQILVDYARRAKSQKRGGKASKVSLEDALNVRSERPDDMLALDDALTALAKLDRRKSQIIHLRYFAGLTVEEASCALGISIATAVREQRLAEAWLYRELAAEAAA